MKINSNAGTSLIFYTGTHDAGTAHPVTHGQTGQLAASSASWTYQSVAMSGMQAFINSAVNPGDPSMVYLGHQEGLVTVSQDDLKRLYPSSDQFPLNYLGVDPALAVVVWLDVDAGQAAPNAVASLSQVGGSLSSLTTLSLPGRRGVLGFAGKDGALVAASCSYGDYNASSGTVAWSGQSGVVVMQYTGGQLTLDSTSGFPEGWTFSDPQLQGDGSWVVTLNGGVPASDTIGSVTANPVSIVNDGVSASVITASVVDGNHQPADGVTVHWSTQQGSVDPLSSVTGEDGMATTTLTDNGAPGTATVTASLDSGSQGSTAVTVTDSAAGYTIVALTSNKDAIENDGVDVAQLTATVQDAQGNLAEGVAVYWNSSLGSLNHAEQDTNGSGQSHAKLIDSGDEGTAEVTASLDNGNQQSHLIALTEVPVTGTLSLYSLAGYQGTSVLLSEHESATLRNAASYWYYDSADMAGARLLSYTVSDPEDADYNYLTYRDDYSATSVPDISQAYAGASPDIIGTALGENDVVVQVHLVRDDITQPLVLSASQRWPQAFSTASVNGDGLVQDGVIAIFDKTQPSTVIPLQVGVLKEDGTADWQVETSVIATWDESLQLPVLTLDSSASDDWQFLNMQATDQAGQYATTLDGISHPILSTYFITDAPALSTINSDESWVPYNMLAIYSTKNARVTATLSGQAYFPEAGNAQEYTFDVQSDGPTLVNVLDEIPENASVVLTVEGSSEIHTGTLTFVSSNYLHSDVCINLNSGAPADGITGNNVYYDTSAQMQNGGYVAARLSGSAKFQGTDNQAQYFYLTGAQSDLEFSVTNTVSESVTVSIEYMEYSGYPTMSGEMYFAPYPPVE